MVRTARKLDADLLPWERQPNETQPAHDAFLRYRDMEKRSIREVGSAALRWSSEWHWQYRCMEWDRHVQRAEAEEMIRYRIKMNQRQRATARVAQSKVIEWLSNLDTSKMRPSEAARWFEVAVRIEREAAGTELPDGVDSLQDEVDDVLNDLAFADLFKGSPAVVDEAAEMDPVDSAEALYRAAKKEGRVTSD